MTTLREAAQMALKALNHSLVVMDSFRVDESWRTPPLEAITALRTALSEPEQEPVATRLIREDFEQRMRAAGYTPIELKRLYSGVYFSPAAHAEWEAEKRKYTPAPDDTTLLRQALEALVAAGLSAHKTKQVREQTITALRERLGEKT